METFLTLEETKDFFAKDNYVVLLGFKVEKSILGKAEVSVEITDKLLNAAGLTHGGLLFSLADFAGAVVTNSQGFVCLSTDSNISYYNRTMKGNRLTAVATQINRSNKLSSIEVNIFDDNKLLIATARCTYYITSKPVLL